MIDFVSLKKKQKFFFIFFRVSSQSKKKGMKSRGKKKEKKKEIKAKYAMIGGDLYIILYAETGNGRKQMKIFYFSSFLDNKW